MAETRRKENIITNFLQNQTNSPITFSTTLSNNVNKFKTTKFTNPSLIYTRKQHQQLLQAEVEKNQSEFQNEGSALKKADHDKSFKKPNKNERI